MVKAKTKNRRGYHTVKKVSHHRKETYHVATLLGTGIGIGVPLAQGYSAGKPAEENVVNMSGSLTQAMFGYDIANHSWSGANLKDFWIPTIGGIATSKIATWTGINRYLPKRFKL